MSDHSFREALEQALDDELCTCEQCEDGDKYNTGVRSVQKAVRAVLAAHPAPVQVEITDEAVEVAAQAMRPILFDDARWPVGSATDTARRDVLSAARKALEAAAPLLGPRLVPVADHSIRIEFDAQRETTELVFVCNAAAGADCHMVCPKGCEECDHDRTEQVYYCNPQAFIDSHDMVVQTAETQPYVTLPVTLSWNGDTYVWTVAGPDAQPLPDRQALATAVDSEAFDETRKRSQHPAAVIQWAARQHMAYKAADALLALLSGAES